MFLTNGKNPTKLCCPCIVKKANVHWNLIFDIHKIQMNPSANVPVSPAFFSELKNISALFPPKWFVEFSQNCEFQLKILSFFDFSKIHSLQWTNMDSLKMLRCSMVKSDEREKEPKTCVFFSWFVFGCVWNFEWSTATNHICMHCWMTVANINVHINQNWW